MKLTWKTQDEGFTIEARADGKQRTRRIAWLASNGPLRENGIIDLSMINLPFELEVRTGWRPETIDIEPIRDATPGAWQPWRSTIPAGICELTIETTTRFSCRVDLLLSPSGNPSDTRSGGTIEKGTCDGPITFIVPSRSPWCLLIIKKMVRSEDAIGLSNVRIFHPVTGQTFVTAGHLIKPEHKSLEKIGSGSMLFRPDAIIYSYFSIGFQKVD